MPFDSITESDVSNDPLIPTPVSAEVIKELPKASATLSLARRVNMGTKSQRQPVLSLLPEAYFVSGDTGRKQTTEVDWENVTLVAEEIAVIVPIPENYLSDSQVPIWDEVRPTIVEAFGRRIDRATIFDVAKPATWGDAVLTHATDAGNVVTEGDSTDDLAADIALLGKELAEDGFDLNGFASGPGLQWRLMGMRTTDGHPVYTQLVGDNREGIYGRPLGAVQNGAWDSDSATIIGGDWSKAIVGVRQDISFKLFTEGVISDDDGNVVLNLMQQDAVAMRAVMRLGWALANPATAVNTTAEERSPFAALVPEGT